MSTATSDRPRQTYVLGRSDEEYERLRAQARVREAATGRLLDQVELAPGARCLDAGCGPGETMRLMASALGRPARFAGSTSTGRSAPRQSRCCTPPATTSARLRPPTSSRPNESPALRLTWSTRACCCSTSATRWPCCAACGTGSAPRRHLVVQDYDLRTVAVLPALDTVDEFNRVVPAAMTSAGCDIHMGHRLPMLFAQAGIGAPDGTDVAGRLEPLASAGAMLAAVYRSVLPVAVSLELTSEQRSAHWFDALARDTGAHGDHQVLWPLMIGAWKRKPTVIR
jgi:hypothetical protein